VDLHEGLKYDPNDFGGRGCQAENTDCWRFLVSDASFTHFLVKLSLEAPANFLSAAAMTTFYNAIAFLRL
jgi:hypothetical protein